MADADYPLLLFPEPAQAERASRPRGGGNVRVPGPSTQGKRLTPQFQRLQDAMEHRRLALQGNPLGLQPEQVLVLEIVGSIDNLLGAVCRVQGLEWLGEYEHDDILPKHGFEDEQKPDKNLKGQLFLVMTDQRALDEMRSLFKSWQDDPDARFPYGLAPLKRAFKYLYTIRRWGIDDRIYETGILDDWRDRLSHDEDEVPFEAELWFRQNSARREQAGSYLRNIIESEGGQVRQQCVIPEIEYHAVLGRLPCVQLQRIMDDGEAFRDIKLLQCEEVMYARPVGQCAIRLSDEDDTKPLTDDDLAARAQRLPSAEGPPVVALFDGLPLTQHRLLDNHLIVDDPDQYEDVYQANERVHGTAMASLMCHGDLNQSGGSPERKLYARPILQPRRSFNGFVEVIPEDALPVDLIHQAVRRLFDEENGEPPAAPSVRFINLSVCDAHRPFVREMSAWARLLDWLAWKYNILFIVSAGNHARDIELGIPRNEFSDTPKDKVERAFIKALAANTRNRRLLSPAETLNGLTVGATHEDVSPPPVGSYSSIDPFGTGSTGLPSVVSAHGPGYRRAVKPDIFLPGGRQFVTEKLGTNHTNATFEVTERTSPPGQRVAAPGSAGQLDRTRYTRGTSNAAALASWGASFLFDLLGRLRAEPGNHLPPEYDVVLTKALLVHGADWSDAGLRYEAALKNSQNSRIFKDYVGRFLGYGTADLAKVMTCTEQRVTVLGFGELDDGDGAEFAFPLPPSLSAVSECRRLTITLAWFSPVNGAHRNYRIAHLWFDPKNDLTPNRQFADHRAVQRGTLQHEVLEGAAAVDFQDGESIAIKVNCRADAGHVTAPIRYGLAVTLEVIERVEARLLPIPIYQEVRERLAIRVPVHGASTS